MCGWGVVAMFFSERTLASSKGDQNTMAETQWDYMKPMLELCASEEI